MSLQSERSDFFKFKFLEIDEIESQNNKKLKKKNYF